MLRDAPTAVLAQLRRSDGLGFQGLVYAGSASWADPSEGLESPQNGHKVQFGEGLLSVKVQPLRLNF